MKEYSFERKRILVFQKFGKFVGRFVLSNRDSLVDGTTISTTWYLEGYGNIKITIQPLGD